MYNYVCQSFCSASHDMYDYISVCIAVCVPTINVKYYNNYVQLTLHHQLLQPSVS